MLTLLTAVVVGALPFAAVLGLLVLAGRVQRAREARLAWQIAVTDAIHRELGAVAAPTVSRRLGGRWHLEVALPLERPALVSAVLAIVQRVLARREGVAAADVRIVLAPRPATPGATVDAPAAVLPRAA